MATRKTQVKVVPEPVRVVDKPRMTAVSASSTSPYSLDALLNVIRANAGIIFIGLSVLIVGFMSGSLWTENKMLKDGYNKNAPVAAAPVAGQPTAQAPDPTPQPLSDADWQTIQKDGAVTMGSDNAKVTMVEFSDYQCPFCGRFYSDSMAQLRKDYIDTGKMKIVFHDLPLPFHPNARIGALAARCGGDQGGVKGYTTMHDTLFSKQNDWVTLSKDDAIAKFGTYAAAGGLNAATLSQCVKDEKFGKVVDADAALAAKVGANGTPTFFINKARVVGALPTATFKATIDTDLASN